MSEQSLRHAVTFAQVAARVRADLRASGVTFDEHTVQALARDVWDAERDEARRLHQREEREAFRRNTRPHPRTT